MKVILSFLAFCFVVQIAWAHHTIKGTVLSAEQRTPLIGAFVGIAGTSKGTITNEFGQFELVIEDTAVTLTISYLGFSEKTIEVDEHSGAIVILLETAAIELAQLRISASEMNSVNTISKLDLKLRPFNSSQEVLRIVPGLFIAQHAGGGKAEQIFLRGFDLDHGTDINITVDGLPVNMVSHAHGQGYADLHFLIPELINVVDFGKGPYYSEKGNLNTAGYVGFTTKSTLNKQVLKIEAGRYNTLRTVGMFNLLGEELALKGHNAIAAVEYNMTDGPFENPQNFNRLNLFTKYTGQFNANNSLTIQLMRMTSKWDASGQIPQRAVDSGELSRFGSVDPTEGGYTSRTDGSLKLVSRLPSGWNMENQLFITNYDFELYSNFTFYLNNPEYGDQIRQKEKRSITGLNGELSKTGGLGKNSLTTKIGYGFRYDEINDLELTNTVNRVTDLERKSLGDVDETNGWLYADATLESGRWLFNGGLRADAFKFDYVDKLDSIYTTLSDGKMQISPKANIIYRINENTRIYLKSGIGFHSNDTRVVVAQDGYQILPSAAGFDLGTSFKPTSNLYINVALWYLYMQQEFVYVGDEAVVEPSGESRRQGLDLSMRWQPFSWLFADFDINYALPVAIGEPEGENYIPLAPTLTSLGGLTIQGQSPWSGTLRYRYIKDRPANEDNSIVALGYFIAEGKVNYTTNFMELGVSLENIFNSDWNEAQFAAETRLKNEPSPVDDLTFTPGVPFFFKLSASFFF